MDGDIVSINYRYIAINRMYTLYSIAKLDHRAEELYKVLSMPRCTNLKIEEIFSVGPKEPKATEAFMEEWIEFLTETPKERAGELLYEATFYKGGIEKVIGTVKSVNTIHPILFVRGCQFLMEEKRYIDALKFGLDALVRLPVHLVIRAEIYNLIIPAAENERNTDVLHRLIKSAYYADSSLGHFLRLFEITEYKNIIEEAAEYAKNLHEKNPWKGVDQDYELQENSISALEKEIILFFSGKYDDLLHQSKEDHTSLGRSSTLKGIAIPILILTMNKEVSLTTAGEKLWGEIIYRFGYSKDYNPSLQESFILWKKKMGVSAEQYEEYHDRVRIEVDKRVEAVVVGGYRYSYHKAALLIVNSGEMLESRGMINGKHSQ